MTYYEKIFAVLGIDPTDDERAIKKAYAKKVKRYHPEEQPEKWQEVHHAYQRALEYAKRQGSDQDDVQPIYTEEEKEQKIFWERETRSESESEEEQYTEIFEEIESGDKWEAQRNKNIEMVQEELSKFLQMPEYVSYEKWERLLKSDAFNRVAEEERVLLYFQQVLTKTRLSFESAGLIFDEMQEVLERLQVSGEIRKIGYLKDILAHCKTCLKYDDSRRNGQGSQTKEQSKKSKTTYQSGKPRSKSWQGRSAGVAVFVLIMIFVKMAWPDFDTSGFSESQAKTAMIEYVNEKYPKIKINEENLYMNEKNIYGGVPAKATECGYRMQLYDTKDEIYLYYWEEEDEIQYICFDNIQRQEIEGAINAYLTEMTEMDAGIVYLAWREEDLKDFFAEGNQFHNLYEGDLEAFFSKEASVKDDLRDRFTELLKLDIWEADRIQGEILANGRCLFAYRDSEISSIADRVKNQTQMKHAKVPEVLEEIAKLYQFEIECMGIPGEYFDKLVLLQDEEVGGEKVLQNLVHESYTKSMTPCMPLFITSYYETGKEAFEGKMFFPEIVQITEGVYAVGATELLQKNPEFLEIEKVETPNSMVDYLAAETGRREIVSYRAVLDKAKLKAVEESDDETYYDWRRQNCVIIFDKEYWELEGERYDVGHTSTDDDRDDRCELLSVIRKATRQLYPYTDVVESGGYLAVELAVSREDSDEIITIAK